VDASVIQAKPCRPNKDKNGESAQAPEVKWNVKAASGGQRKSTYGFKAHINIDEDRLIKSARLCTRQRAQFQLFYSIAG
jgi:IS5 family transposase